MKKLYITAKSDAYKGMWTPFQAKDNKLFQHCTGGLIALKDGALSEHQEVFLAHDIELCGIDSETLSPYPTLDGL